MAVVAGIRLPAIDDPWLDLQLCRREVLDAKAIEKPRCIRRNKRGLISPIIEVVITKQSNIRNEDTRVDVQAVGNIPVISAPSLGNVPVSIGQVPLTAVYAAVIARGRGGEQAIHEENPPAHVVDTDVAADADL